MSMAPFTLHGTRRVLALLFLGLVAFADSFLRSSYRWGVKYGVGSELKDSLSESLIDQNPTREVTPMGCEFSVPLPSLFLKKKRQDLNLIWVLVSSSVTAENLAAKYGITREDCDRESTFRRPTLRIRPSSSWSSPTATFSSPRLRPPLASPTRRSSQPPSHSRSPHLRPHSHPKGREASPPRRRTPSNRNHDGISRPSSSSLQEGRSRHRRKLKWYR